MACPAINPVRSDAISLRTALDPADNPIGDSPVFQVRDLYKHYGALEVLRGISMTAKRGDVIAIVGGSGSGKSTFLRCLNLLCVPDAGDITVLGEHLRLKKTRLGMVPADMRQVRAVRSRVAMVFQNFNLWSHMNVLENVIEASVHVLKTPRKQAIEKAETLLVKVGLQDKIKRYPAELSGGQQQRVAIARALHGDPEIMLFDEPTSALDPELVGEVLQVMSALAQEGRTMLVVTHEIGFAREVANHAVFFYQGIIEEKGNPSEVLSTPNSPILQQFISRIR